MFTGFTPDAREESKAYLYVQTREEAYGKFTPVEQILLRKFGTNMTRIIEQVLKMWAHAMLAKLREEPGLRPIRERDYVNLIMGYLKLFQQYSEDKFGKMEDGLPPSVFGEIRDNTVYIKSTGYGAKVVLGLLMADRMHVVEKKRKRQREKIGYDEMDVSEVEHDSKDCLICQDPMGVETAEGTKETPLRLVICCGQIIGQACLRVWLSELASGVAYRRSCPVCRFKFPDSFLAKLFSKKEYEARLTKEREGDFLTSPSPPPLEVFERDAQLPEESIRLEEGEVMEEDVVMAVRTPTVFEASQRYTHHQGEPHRLEEDEIMEDDFDMEG